MSKTFQCKWKTGVKEFDGWHRMRCGQVHFVTARDRDQAKRYMERHVPLDAPMGGKREVMGVVVARVSEDVAMRGIGAPELPLVWRTTRKTASRPS